MEITFVFRPTRARRKAVSRVLITVRVVKAAEDCRTTDVRAGTVLPTFPPGLVWSAEVLCAFGGTKATGSGNAPRTEEYWPRKATLMFLD